MAVRTHRKGHGKRAVAGKDANFEIALGADIEKFVISPDFLQGRHIAAVAAPAVGTDAARCQAKFICFREFEKVKQGDGAALAVPAIEQASRDERAICFQGAAQRLDSCFAGRRVVAK